MTVIKTVSHSGTGTIGSLGGDVNINEAKGQLLAFNGSNNIGLFGFDSTGHVAVKVAKEGYDADTATDEQLIFNSDQNLFKIITTGTVNISAGPSDTERWETVAHGLGFVPGVIAFLTDVNMGSFASHANIPLPTWTSASFDLTNHYIKFGTYLQAFVDSTNLIIYMNNATGAANPTTGSWVIRYYLIQETAGV